jgi:hypothetical protein
MAERNNRADTPLLAKRGIQIVLLTAASLVIAIFVNHHELEWQPAAVLGLGVLCFVFSMLKKERIFFRWLFILLLVGLGALLSLHYGLGICFAGDRCP